ncbi:MAG TPA: hypothetical protein VHP58_00335 [Alphaproteobacteria bacterium]|nr:hypothetical protein [Alphaproteobacteria bacterium]
MATFTVLLADSSLEAFNNLKENTDAKSDNEVFLNALSLYNTLVNAKIAGNTFHMTRNGKTEVLEIFAEVDEPIHLN